jgi:hypothetical protein
MHKGPTKRLICLRKGKRKLLGTVKEFLVFNLEHRSILLELSNLAKDKTN